MNEITVIRSELVIILKALLEDVYDYYDNDYGYGFYCNYCHAELAYTRQSEFDEKSFPHNKDCPHLVALSMSTGLAELKEV